MDEIESSASYVLICRAKFVIGLDQQCERTNLVGSNCVGVFLLLVNCNFRTKSNKGADIEGKSLPNRSNYVATLQNVENVKWLKDKDLVFPDDLKQRVIVSNGWKIFQL